MAGPPASAPHSAGGDAVLAAARAGEPDRHLAALLSPQPAREALLALAALSAELARVPLIVTREPAMGDIRLQWWRDQLELPADAAPSGHPVADAVRAAAQRYALPIPLLQGIAEARALDLEAAPFPDDAALRGYLWKTQGALFELAGRVVGLTPDAPLRAASASAGNAYGLALLLLGLPQALARGRLPLPLTRLATAGLDPAELQAGAAEAKVAGLLTPLLADARASLAEARQFASGLPRGQRVAFLPLALVEPYVRALERRGRQVLRQQAGIAPLRRVVRIAGAQLLGRM